MPRSSAGARPTAARRRLSPKFKRSVSIAPNLPTVSTASPRARASWKRATAKSPSGWTRPSPASSPCSIITSKSMATVNATIAGRQFRLACEDGQEDHLQALARDLDQRIIDLRAKFGEIGDTRLTVMTALMVADELAEAMRRIRLLEEEVAALQDARVVASDRARAASDAVVGAFNSAAERLEGITRKLNQSLGNGVAIGGALRRRSQPR